jgi:hypothetical protein
VETTAPTPLPGIDVVHVTVGPPKIFRISAGETEHQLHADGRIFTIELLTAKDVNKTGEPRHVVYTFSVVEN